MDNKRIEQRREKKQKQKEEKQKSLEIFKKNIKRKIPKKNVRQQVDIKAMFMDVCWIFNYSIKNDNFLSNKSSKEQQIIDCVRHYFFRYNVPKFLYSIFLRPKYFDIVQFSRFFSWFIAITQGQSFYKVAKPILNKKESHLFIKAPHADMLSNIWWSRIMARSFSTKNVHPLVKSFRAMDYTSQFKIEFLDFIKRFEEQVDINSLTEINDFLNFKKQEDPSFSLKGRTWNSIVQLSNEWHLSTQVLDTDETWEGLDIDDWTYEIEKPYLTIWEVKQLKNSKQLFIEGSKMSHCVYSYLEYCIKGSIGIFSMIKDSEVDIKQKHEVTIEVNRHLKIIQTKGKCNKTLNPEQQKILKLWAKHNGLKLKW
jgi:hypothetical protein